MERLGRFLGAFFGAFLCIVLLMGIYSIAEEEITLTTYYPAPYGAYDAMYSTTLGVGDNNGDTVLGNSGDAPDPTISAQQGDVWIKGQVGIGTTSPTVGTVLDANGTINATTYSAGGTSPVADGTYTVGKGAIQDGTITVKGGIITAIQQAAN